jgi:hypothetical protein
MLARVTVFFHLLKCLELTIALCVVDQLEKAIRPLHVLLDWICKLSHSELLTFDDDSTNIVIPILASDPRRWGYNLQIRLEQSYLEDSI